MISPREPGSALHRVRFASVRQAPPGSPPARGRLPARAGRAGSARTGSRSRCGRPDRNSRRRPRSPRRSPTAIRFRTGRLLRIRYCRNCTGSCRSCVRVSRVSLGKRRAIRLEHLRTCRAPAIARRIRPRIVRIADRRSSASTSASSRLRSEPVAASFSVSRSGGPFQRKYDSFDASSYSSSGSACGSACCSRSGTGTAATSARPAARPSRCPEISPLPAYDFSKTATSEDSSWAVIGRRNARVAKSRMI